VEKEHDAIAGKIPTYKFTSKKNYRLKNKISLTSTHSSQ